MLAVSAGALHAAQAQQWWGPRNPAGWQARKNNGIMLAGSLTPTHPEEELSHVDA
jgi:hypothetical protein